MIPLVTGDTFLDILKQEAPHRIHEYKELKEKTLKEYSDVKNEIIEQLGAIGQHFNYLFAQIDQNDILIPLFQEINQYGNQMTTIRKNEIISKLQHMIEYKPNDQQGSYQFKLNQEKQNLQHTIKRMITTLQQIKSFVQTLRQFENDQYICNSNSQIQNMNQKHQVSQPRIQQPIQQIGIDLSYLDTSNINFQLTFNLAGHSNQIWSVAVSHDDKYIATGDSGYEIFLWDSKTRMILKQYKGPQNTLNLQFSKNNLRLAAAGINPYDIFIYDIEFLNKNDPIQVLKGHTYNIYRTIFINEITNLISSSADKTVRVWDVDGQREISQKQLTNCIYGLCLSDNQELVGCGCLGGLAYLLESKELASLTEKIIWQAHRNEVDCIEFIKNSTIILTSSRQEIRFWRVEDLFNGVNQCIKEIQSTDNNNYIWTVKAIPVENPKIIIASQGKIKIWQFEPNEVKQTIDIPGGITTCGSTFATTSDFKTLITAAKDMNPKIYQKVLN